MKAADAVKELTELSKRLKRCVEENNKVITQQRACIDAPMVEQPLEVLLKKVKAFGSSQDPADESISKRLSSSMNKDSLAEMLSKCLLNHASSVISDTKIDELTQEVNKLSEKLDAKSYAEATRHSSPRGASRPSLPPPPPFGSNTTVLI